MPRHDEGEAGADQLSRRRFLRVAATGVAAIGAGGVLAACGSSSGSTPTAHTAAKAKPKRGGTLAAGFTGGSSSDTLSAEFPVNNLDWARNAQLYEPLVRYGADAQYEFVLAEEITPNADATVWTVRLRSGVTFHNGKSLTADDLIYTLQTIFNKKTPAPESYPLGAMDVAGLKKLDSRTVQIPYKSPFSTFKDPLCYGVYLIPVGYDPTNPVGTGPFRYKTFTAGVESTFVRNDSYWQFGLPYVDEVVITNYPDETTQLNALAAGQVNLVNLLSSTAISQVAAAGAKTVISPGGGFTPFTMRTDVAPFNDVRVRQAFRYIIDRPQMRELVFGGHGTLGNDIFSIWDPLYDHSIPQREQDIAHAKFLLKQAGQENLTVELVTAPVAEGTVLAAQVLAQQAKAAGVTVNLRQTTVTEFYGSQYLKWTFAQDYWYYDRYLLQVGSTFLPTSLYNETHFNDPKYTALYNEGVSTLDRAKQRSVIAEMQQIDYDSGGYIIPYFPPIIDGYSSKVNGVIPSKVGASFNQYDFKNLWLS